MNKLTGISVAAILSAGALVGCGGGSDSTSSDTYCSDVKAARTQINSFTNGASQTTDIATLIERVHTIAGEAPSDIKASWTVLDTEFGTLKTAVEKAGLSLDDLQSVIAGNVPPGTDITKLTELGNTLKNMATPDVSAAGDKITAEVKKECNIDLNTGN